MISFSNSIFLFWFRLLPNVDCLDVELSEFEYCLMNDSIIENLHFFFQRLHRLILDYSSIINKEMNEQIMKPLLSFMCKNISLSWINIDQWIDFILS